MKKEKEIIEENTNGEKNKYLDRQNVKAFYEFDTFEFMQPDENGLGLSENNIVVAEKEMLDKDGKTITVFEFFKDGQSIAITNEKGEIMKQSAADILMHELVGHAIPRIAPSRIDTGNAIKNENIIRKELNVEEREEDEAHMQ